MSDPSLIVQAAIVAALKADPALTILVAGRVYDQPPAAPAMPYVTLGEDHVMSEAGDGYDGADITLTLHVWSIAIGFPEAKRIAAALVAALSPDLVLGEGRLIDITYADTRYLREPDGVTSHAVLTFTALTEPS